MPVSLDEEHASRFYRPHLVDQSSAMQTSHQADPASAAVSSPSSHHQHHPSRIAGMPDAAAVSRDPVGHVSATERGHGTHMQTCFLPSSTAPRAHGHGHVRPRLLAEEERLGRWASCDIEVAPRGGGGCLLVLAAADVLVAQVDRVE